jgi:hypothetical protein
LCTSRALISALRFVSHTMRSFTFFVLPFGAFSSSCIDADEASLLQVHGDLGKEDPPTREYSETLEHRIDAQAQQVTARVTFDTDGDITIRAENNPEHGTHSMSGYLKHATYSQHRVCVGASDDAVDDIENYHAPEFTLEEPICFNKLNIGYLAGYVNCRNPEHGRSHYGCDQDSIGLVLGKKTVGDNYDVVFPKAVKDGGESSAANREWNEANIEGYSFMDHGHADWYTVSGYTGDENNLQLKLKEDGEGGFFLPKGDYRLWYHEDLTEGTENDNSGVACYHLDFELCQGTHQSSWSISEALLSRPRGHPGGRR